MQISDLRRFLRFDANQRSNPLSTWLLYLSNSGFIGQHYLPLLLFDGKFPQILCLIQSLLVYEFYDDFQIFTILVCRIMDQLLVPDFLVILISVVIQCEFEFWIWISIVQIYQFQHLFFIWFEFEQILLQADLLLQVYQVITEHVDVILRAMFLVESKLSLLDFGKSIQVEQFLA